MKNMRMRQMKNEANYFAVIRGEEDDEEPPVVSQPVIMNIPANNNDMYLFFIT